LAQSSPIQSLGSLKRVVNHFREILSHFGIVRPGGIEVGQRFLGQHLGLGRAVVVEFLDARSGGREHEEMLMWSARSIF
jgi:hypothetical protein